MSQQLHDSPSVEASSVGEQLNRLPADAFGRKVTGPLAGTVVADFSRVLAGPYCTMLLADMGATVVKVESPGGDETRGWKPPTFNDTSTYYLSLNRNKRSIALDFSNEEDLQTARDIAAKADVVIENFKPGGLEKFGLDYQSISQINPSAVFASITGFGTAGGAGLPGYDLLVQAMSGLMSLTGAPETPAYRTGMPIFDVITGLHAAIGILAALHERSMSGLGQHVEVNLMSSALSGLVNQTGGYVLSGHVPTRMGNEHPSIYPYEPFPTGDGDIILAIGNDRQFQKLCDVLDVPELKTDPRFSTAPQRNPHRAELRLLLIERLSTRSAQEWFDVFTEARLPCAPINDVRGGIEFAERLGLDPVVHIGDGENKLPGIRNPLSFSKTPPSYDLAPPEINADQDEIQRWLKAKD